MINLSTTGWLYQCQAPGVFSLILGDELRIWDDKTPAFFNVGVLF